MTRQTRPLIRLFLWIISVFAGLFATIAAETPLIDPADIRPGMKCRGVSSFEPGVLEELDVEIIGIVNGPTLETSYILARVNSPSIRRGGIMAGMSGSPVYYENRLVGAISQAFAFASEPLCGITPASAMRRLTALSRAAGRDPVRPKPPTQIAGAQPSGSLRPIGLALQTTGGFEPLLSTDPAVSTLHVSPVSAMSGASDMPDANPDEIRPGSPVAVGLVTGDVTISVFGTVTDVQDGMITAFGHQMFGLGSCRLPLHASDVVSFIPTRNISFKVANSGPPIGTLLFDAEAGVIGAIGPIPPVITVKSVIEGLTPEPVEYRFTVADHEYLSANLIAQALFGLIRNLGGFTGDLTLRTDLSVALDNGMTLQRTHLDGGVDNLFNAIMTAVDPVDQILRNPLEPVTIGHVDIRCSLRQATALATLDALSLPRKRYRPGETVRLTLNFHGDRTPFFTRSVLLTLPESLPAGRYFIRALDSAGHRLQLAAGALPPHHHSSFETWFRTLSEPIASNQILIGLMEEVNDVQTAGAVFPAAPPLLQGLLTMPGMDNRSVRSVRVLASETLTLDDEVFGMHQIPVYINIRPEMTQ